MWTLLVELALAAAAVALQAAHRHVSYDAGFMYVDPVAIPAVAACLVIGFRASARVLAVTVLAIWMLDDSGTIGAALKLVATLPGLVILLWPPWWLAAIAGLACAFLVGGGTVALYAAVGEGISRLGAAAILLPAAAAVAAFLRPRRPVDVWRPAIALRVLLTVVFVRGALMVLGDTFFAVPVYFGRSFEDTLRSMPAWSVVAWNAVQATIDLGGGMAVAWLAGRLREGAMRSTAALLAFIVIGLSQPAWSQAPPAAIETTDFVVTAAAGGTSGKDLARLAGQAEDTLQRILAFWSASAGTDRFGKIRVSFEPPRRDIYSSVFYWEQAGGTRVRAVRVFGTEGAPQMMAHKLTSAVFPQRDKLIRNMMGTLAETQVGNPLTFPMCGLSADDWVRAIVDLKSYIPLDDLGPDHESWGMADHGSGRLSVHDKARQHRAYAEAGSFGSYLFRTYGVNRIKRLQRLSQTTNRPWRDAFNADLRTLEANWLETLAAGAKASSDNVAAARRLLGRDPESACAEAQRLTAGRR